MNELAHPLVIHPAKAFQCLSPEFPGCGARTGSPQIPGALLKQWTQSL